MTVLFIWLGLMGLFAAGAAWFFFARFPEVFGGAGRRRALRGAAVAGLVLSGLALLAGLVMLVFMRVMPVD